MNFFGYCFYDIAIIYTIKLIPFANDRLRSRHSNYCLFPSKEALNLTF